MVITLEANLTQRIPWSRKAPNSAGPEGWIPDDLLPCHYYVQSLGSKAEFEFKDPSASFSLSSQGQAHMEANWGTFFPVSWLWSEGMSQDDSFQFVYTGGDFQIGTITTVQNVLAIRGGVENLDWDFRNVDLDSFNVTTSACQGTMTIHAKSADGHREVVVHASAPFDSFSDRLYFPTKHGFQNTPGCVESYIATMSFDFYDHKRNKHWTRELKNNALEFGGKKMC
eukprot:m.15053 g.15053  ORF g.15053 m.15053 type:complete len:226 (+) comp9475_c0_seq1:531-1208(+)